MMFAAPFRTEMSPFHDDNGELSNRCLLELNSWDILQDCVCMCVYVAHMCKCAIRQLSVSAFKYCSAVLVQHWDNCSVNLGIRPVLDRH